MHRERTKQGIVLHVPERDGRPVVELHGPVDASMTNELSEVLAGVEHLRDNELIVDLKGVELIDSAALGTLVFAQKQARRHGGDVVLAGVGGRVKRVLELTGLNRTFRLVGRVGSP